MIGALLDAMPRRGFVIMPFSADFTPLYDFVIEPAIFKVGDRPIRLDRTGLPGDVASHVRDGIRRCDYAIGVLDGLRANVLYELGLAHGAGKPTILMNRAGTLGEISIAPFDISTQQRLEYDSIGVDLLRRLEGVLATLPLRRA
jgi:hypothetical protein